MTRSTGNELHVSPAIWWTVAIGGLFLTTAGIVINSLENYEWGLVWLGIGALCAIVLSITEPRQHEQ